MWRPFKGVVSGMRRGFMLIKLESRATIAAFPVEGISRGDVVELVYDFTHNRVVDIWPEGHPPKVPPKEPDLDDETLAEETLDKVEESSEMTTFSFPSFEGGGEGE